ncbi:MAG: BPTD_3080 family restriction endonuclease [Nitrospinales bacterium]
MKQIDQLIINSPYKEPARYWKYDRETRLFSKEEGRRPAGYVVATPGSKSFDDPGQFIELPLVNKIRPRIKAWREAGYPGVTGITKRLLEHWRNEEERDHRKFFFCQLEAIETLIWLNEAPAAERQGIAVPDDGGPFTRLCSKMATGSGKTIVMAMMIAWQVINKVTYPQDKRFSKYVFIVAPGLTVKSRLQVLHHSGEGNYYDEFNIVPLGLREKLRQGKIRIHNWHKLNWEEEERIARKKGVDKRGAKSDEAYVREVLGDMANARNILVINDEAHHAWRVPAESKIRDVKKEEIEEATKWLGGLDRIHKARGILTCYDLSATPFAPSGKQAREEALFPWVVSDFGLNDAIESGLVKTPRVVVRDDAVPDAKTYKSKLYHLYMADEVKDGLNKKAEEQEPLPDLVLNAYLLLGLDWRETAKSWKKSKLEAPPVMITVANRTETAARIKYSFDKGKIDIDELCNPDLTLHIDSSVLKKAEEVEEPVFFNGDDGDEGTDEKFKPKITKQKAAEILRQKVNTIGDIGKLGGKIQNVISVGMLSEGWDTKTVTHIMGLRAFSSQLLCEQVIGRGLRRTSYEVGSDGLFQAEYVNIFGVPFTFLPHEEGDGPPPPPPTPKTRIEPVVEKKEFEISWPNIIRINHVYKPKLELDLEKVDLLRIDASKIIELAEMAPTIAGKPDVTKISQIALEKLGRESRLQRIIFKVSASIFDQMKSGWKEKGNREYLLGQVICLVEKFINSDRVEITPPLFNQDPMRKRILLILRMTNLVHHIWETINFDNSLELIPVFDSENPIRSTGDMLPWYSGKPCERTKRSHINFCVFDSAWESTEAFHIENDKKNVAAWVKNDHLGFEIHYVYKGVVHKYRPDFLIRLTNGEMLVLEVKGQDTQKEKTKRNALDEWVKAVNQHGGFGKWMWGVSFAPSDIAEILGKCNKI